MHERRRRITLSAKNYLAAQRRVGQHAKARLCIILPKQCDTIDDQFGIAAQSGERFLHRREHGVAALRRHRTGKGHMETVCIEYERVAPLVEIGDLGRT